MAHPDVYLTETDFVDVKFQSCELNKITCLARERQASNVKGKHKSRLVDSRRTDSGSHFHGVFGEATFCKYMGWPLDRIRVDQPGGDAGWDFVVQNLTIDVKITEKRRYNLLRFERGKGHEADYYVLVWPKADNCATLIGATTLKRFEDECFPTPTTHIGHIVPWNELISMRQFQEALAWRQTLAH